MGDFEIDLLKLHANNVTSTFLEVITYCFFAPHIQQSVLIIGSSTILKNNIFLESLEFLTFSCNLLCPFADHLLQFLVLKDFRVSYQPKYEQISEHNYTFFNDNAFKSKINQIDWKTLFDSHDMNLCFEKYLKILTCTFDDNVPIKKLLEKQKSLIDIPWNFLRH